MKKILLILTIMMFTVSWVFAEKAAPIQYDPSNYPAPTRQGGDDIPSATVISSLPYSDTGTTVGYNNFYDEVCPYTGSTSPDVVYSYTPLVNMLNGYITLCIDVTNYDTKLYIYEDPNYPSPGTGATGVYHACNDDACSSPYYPSYVSELTGLTFTAGTTYYIIIDGYGGESGEYQIDFTADSSITGTLEGYVTEFGTGTPIEGAVVSITGTGLSATTLADGSYSIADILVGIYDISCEADLYVTSEELGFEIVEGTNTLDFSLLWSEIAVNVTELTSYLLPDETEVQTFTITNAGPGDLEYNISFDYPDEASGDIIPRPNYLPYNDNYPRREDVEVSAGIDLSYVRYENSFEEPSTDILRGSIAWFKAGEYSTYFYGTFDTDTPGDMTEILSPPAWNAYCGDFDAVNTDFFYTNNPDDYNTYTIDCATGAATLVGPTGLTAFLNGMACDKTEGTMYAVNSTDLYTIDLSTGAATLVGPIGNTGGLMLTLACDGNGDLWGVDLNLDTLWNIDKDTGAGTEIGPVGFNCGYAQSMSWDPESDIVFWAAYGGGLDGNLRIVDTTTGATTLVGAFEGGREVTVLAFPGTRDTWVSITNNASGVVPANGGTIEVEVTFDTAELLMGDVLTADLLIHNNSNYTATRGDDYVIPVTLNVGATTLNPPQNLFVDDTGYATWEAPAAGGDWLFYHDGTFEMGLASTAGGAGIAQMFQPDSYPCTIEQVEYFVNQEGVNGQEIEVWIIADDLATVLGGPYTINAVLDWNTIDIDDIVITSGEFLVATYNVLAGGPFIGCDDSLYNGTLYFGSHTGGFTELGVYGYYYVGSHGAFVTYGTDSIVAKHQVLKPVAFPVNKSDNSDIAVNNTYRDATDRHTRDLLGYNVYLDGGTPPAFTTDLFYQYTGLVNGTTYLSEVTALYDEGESDPIDYTFTYVEEVILTLPVFEGFEGGTIPESWTQEYVSGTEDWDYTYGVNSSHPADPHTGAFNAYFNGSTGNITKLVTAQIDMGTATDVELTFWHAQQYWSPDQDYLRVYYKNSAAGAWTMLAEYLNDIPDWTEEIITLPDLTDDYYIAFEGEDGWGYGIGVDDISIESATTLDPPVNVVVDEESGIVTWDPPAVTIYTDDFEAYNVGEYLAVQSDDWTTWGNAPGTAEDAYISDDYALSGTNSVKVDGTTDLVLIMEDYTTGRYAMDLNLYIPTGYCGYYNLQKTSTPGQEWGIQTMFGDDGIASIDGGGAAACTFPFNFDTWLNFVIIVDLDDDLCEFYFDGTLMHSYQWTLGCFGTPGLLQLGGMNMFAWDNAGASTPLYYFDDVLFLETYEEPVRDLIGYKVYLDTVLQATVGTDVFEYPYTGLTPDQTYTAGVSALYDEGESEIIEFEFTYTPVTTFDPPENLVATVVNYNEVELVWEVSSMGDWLFYHDGTFEMGLASTAGGAGIAQMFQPDSYPCTIEQIEYFVSQEGENGQEIEVWIIADDLATVLGGPYTINAVLDWNTIDIDDIVITSGEFLVATYNVLAGGPFIGCDDSLYNGTLYFGSHTGGFTELGVYGYYYVGSHGAYVSYGNDSDIVAKHQVLKPVAPVNKFSVSDIAKATAMNRKKAESLRDIRRDNTQQSRSRYLAGYKVYRDAVEIAEITDPYTLTYTDDEGICNGIYDYYVTAVYIEPAGESVPSNIESVEIILPIPQNPQAVFNYPNVLVTWNPVSDSRDLLGYNVYRDEEQVGFGITSTMFIDPDLPNGEYCYNITAVYDGDCESEFSDDAWVIVSGSNNILIPVRTELTGNYPNPFNPETKIKFALKEAGDVSLKIYNIKGAVVRALVDGEMNAAYHEIIWDGKDNAGKQVGSGVYFYKMKAEKYTATKKMILMK